MLKRILCTAAMLLLPFALPAQNDETLRKEVIESGYIHRPLKLHDELSVEAFDLTKPVLASELLCDMESLEGWSHRGHGSIRLTSERSADGGHSLRIASPSMPAEKISFGIGRGSCMATFDVGGRDWTSFNRIRLKIYPHCEGMRSIYMNLGFTNDGKVKIPDRYGREGVHEMNLRNNEWNDCTLEFPELPRDNITAIHLTLEIFGRELTMGDSLLVDVDDIRLERIEQPEVARGWQPGRDRIIVCGTGYTPGASKTAIIGEGEKASGFEVADASGKRVLKGKVRKVKTELGQFRTADFSSLTTPGTYRVKVGKLVSVPFRIGDDVWEDSAWRMLNFLFCERCGYPVPGKHGSCHGDLHIDYDGKVIPIHGGWHDAGDMAQQTLQTGEISYSLLQMARNARGKGDVLLYNRLVEEAMWGMDFVLRSRLGNGVRMISWGTNLWTDGILGTDDDAGGRVCNVYDGGYENFVLAGIEAYAAMMLEDDPEMVHKLTKSAVEDFGWGLRRYEEAGYMELQTAKKLHAKNTPESQYNASVSWAASQLFRLTGDHEYARQAVRFIELPLQCQETGSIGGVGGFFYGDADRRSGVHYSHKSRDYAFMEALAELLETQPGHPDAEKWKASMGLYAGYLKSIMKYVAPYGMVPSGVYDIREVDFPELFFPWQLGAPRDGSEREEYLEQLRNGVRLDNNHYLRRFPVWYSFRGNTVVSLSTGKAAAICARALGDKELMDIAEKQLSWVVGMNPFGQSLIYGEGAFWGQMYNALPGEMTGEIPVGIQTLGNEDLPYWPQFNIATPKEVFGLTASRWLMLVSEF